MIRLALSVAVGLLGICLAVAAQQENWRGATKNDPAFALSLYKPEIFSGNNRSLLFHKGRVQAWSDGGRLTSETALAEIGMASLDLFPVAYLPPNASWIAPKKGASPANDPPFGNLGSDGKDLPGMMTSPLDQVCYGGEVGILYGRWTDKGGGDLMQSYILGTVGNDKFQISVGAAYEESSGHSARYRSYVVPR
jgi:hypothetical protein